VNNGPLVIVPCGQAKVWDREPARGPVAAKDAYTGAPFKVNRQYAERFGRPWVILSAKYGFILPEFPIPGPYNVTFKRAATHPVEIGELRRQVRVLGLDRCAQVIGLGGIEYRRAIEQAFAGTTVSLYFPFAGRPIGLMMQATKRAVADGRPLPPF